MAQASWKSVFQTSNHNSQQEAHLTTWLATQGHIITEMRHPCSLGGILMVSIASLLFCILMLVMTHFSDFTAHRRTAMLSSAPEFQTGVRKLGTRSKARCEAEASMDNA